MTHKSSGFIIKSPSKMAEFSNRLEPDFLTIEERVAVASAVAWLLLLTKNAFHSSEEELKDEISS